MYSWKLDFEHEESPAASQLMSIYITVEFEGIKMKDILNIDGLFDSIMNTGYQPLFTCKCGDFGCGGYYVYIAHEKEYLKLVNSYDPRTSPSEESIIDRFEFEISWEDLNIMSSTVLDYLVNIKEKYLQHDLCSGTYGQGLIGLLEKYKKILKCLKSRYDD